MVGGREHRPAGPPVHGGEIVPGRCVGCAVEAHAGVAEVLVEVGVAVHVREGLVEAGEAAAAVL